MAISLSVVDESRLFLRFAKPDEVAVGTVVIHVRVAIGESHLIAVPPAQTAYEVDEAGVLSILAEGGSGPLRQYNGWLFVEQIPYTKPTPPRMQSRR